MTEQRARTTKSAGKPQKASCLFRREEGQSAFEFLLIIPIFVLAFLLVIDLGMMMYQFVSVSNAVREGARYGSINCGGSCTGDKVKTRVIDRSGGILSEGDASTEIWADWLDNGGNINAYDRGDSVVVRIVHPYEFMFFPATIPVSSCADMSLEQSDQGGADLSVVTTGC